jgi:peptide methionine sulfoxide reductase MsrA
MVEQDHRRVKQRLRPMLGLKSFRTAARVISGIELAAKIKKSQFKIGKLGGRTATMPRICTSPFWEAEAEHQDYLERFPNGYTCHFIRPDWKLPVQADVRRAG